jgi:hybrid cluster-associated redox disulfide protein
VEVGTPAGPAGGLVRGLMAKFTRDMSILKALQADPRARDVFTAHGLACIGCMGAMLESIEDGAKMHGIDTDAILRELNSLPPLSDDRES